MDREMIARDRMRKYPYISIERLDELVNIGANEEQLDRANYAGKEEIDNRLNNHTLGEIVALDIDPAGRPQLKVAVIGTSGSGKSATGNTLLQKKRFNENTGTVSRPVTEDAIQSTHDPLLTVVDTSGSWTLPKVGHNHDRIDLYVLVVNMASVRFSRDDLKKIRTLEDYNNIVKSKRCILLLTHASDALRGMSLEDYLQEIRGDPLYDLIMYDMAKQRVMAIDNNCDTAYEAERQYAMIDCLLKTTYENANLAIIKSPSRVLKGLAIILSIVVIFLIVFLLIWYDSC